MSVVLQNIIFEFLVDFIDNFIIIALKYTVSDKVTSFFNFGFIFFTLILRIHEFFGFETAAEHCGIC